MLQFYRDKGIYVEVDGTSAIDAVQQRISTTIQNELSKRLFNVVLFGYPGSGRVSKAKRWPRNLASNMSPPVRCWNRKSSSTRNREKDHRAL